MFQIVIFLLYRALCYLKFLTNIYCSYNQKKKWSFYFGCQREIGGGTGQSQVVI